MSWWDSHTFLGKVAQFPQRENERQNLRTCHGHLTFNSNIHQWRSHPLMEWYHVAQDYLFHVWLWNDSTMLFAVLSFYSTWVFCFILFLYLCSPPLYPVSIVHVHFYSQTCSWCISYANNSSGSKRCLLHLNLNNKVLPPVIKKKKMFWVFFYMGETMHWYPMGRETKDKKNSL